MPIKISKINKVELKLGRILKETLKKAAEKVIKKSSRIESAITQAVKKYTNEVFKTNPILRSIAGEGGGDEDLQAHFGLTPDRASDAKQKILEAIKESVFAKIVKGPIKRVSETGTSSLGLEIVVYGTTTEEFESKINIKAEPFTYVSVARKRKKARNGKKLPKSTIIPWMKWVLNPMDTLIEKDIPSIRDYNIVFDSGFKYSRSGKAIMKSNRSRGQSNFSFYKLPLSIFPKGKSKNFIEQVFNSSEYKDDVSKIVSSSFAKLRTVLR